MKPVILLLLSVLVALNICTDIDARKWKIKSGGSFEADLNGLTDDGQEVNLRFPDGHRQTMKLEDFTTYDQEYIKRAYNPLHNNKLITIQSTGMAETFEKALLEAEKVAIRQVNGEGFIGETVVRSSFYNKTSGSGESYPEVSYSDELSESYISSLCGFCKKREVIHKEYNDGLWTVTANVQVYRYLLDENFSHTLTPDERLRRNDSIDDQLLFIKKLMGRYDFPFSCFKVQCQNFQKTREGCAFDCITHCNRENYFAFSRHLVHCLERMAIKNSSFSLNCDDFSSGYQNVLKFFCSDVDANVLGLKKKNDRVFLCICTFHSADYRYTAWELFELPRKFMFLLEPYAHLMSGIQVSLVDNYGGEVRKLPPFLPEIRPYSPRAASFSGIWNARFRSRMNDEAVIGGSTFAVFNPSTPYNYEYVNNRFNKSDKMLNPPYCRVYSIQPFFISAKPDKTNLVFPYLCRHIEVPLSSYDKSKVVRANMQIAPLSNQGRRYFMELEDHLHSVLE